jgi:hypothetical protein
LSKDAKSSTRFNGLPNSSYSPIVNGKSGLVVVLNISTYGASANTAPTKLPYGCRAAIAPTSTPPADLPNITVLPGPSFVIFCYSLIKASKSSIDLYLFVKRAALAQALSSSPPPRTNANDIAQPLFSKGKNLLCTQPMFVDVPYAP